MDFEIKTVRTDFDRQETTLQIEEPEFHSPGAGPLRRNLRPSINKRTKKIPSRSRPHKIDKPADDTPHPTTHVAPPPAADAGAQQHVHVPGVAAVQPQGKGMHAHEEDDDEGYTDKEEMSFYRRMFFSLTFLYAIPFCLLVWTFYSPTIKVHMSQPFGLYTCLLGVLVNVILGYIHCTNTCTRWFPANYVMNVISSMCMFMITAYISMKVANALFVIMSIFFGITCVAMANWIIMLATIKIRYGFKVIGVFTAIGTVLSFVFLLLVVRIVFKGKATFLQIIATLIFGALFNFLPYMKFYMILTDWSIDVGADEGPYCAWVIAHAYYTVLLVLVRKMETFKN